jgi:hypothetical protein
MALSKAEAGSEVIVRDGTLAHEAPPDATTPIEERMAKQVRTLEAWYAAEFERRLTELSEMLKMQLQVQIEELKQHYERREKTIQEKAQVSTGAYRPENLAEEIKRTEVVALMCAGELERMVADDTVNLGLLLQMRNQQLEVRSYLRGLKFGSEGGQASPATTASHETI